MLKNLALLRSKATAIRGSLSGRIEGADPAAVSEVAVGLLRLDAKLTMISLSSVFQSVCRWRAGFWIRRGPMIREWKRVVREQGAHPDLGVR